MQHAILILICAFGTLAGVSVRAEDYSVKEVGRNLEVMTPYGKRTFIGDFTLPDSGNYRIEIPIERVRPQGPAWREAASYTPNSTPQEVRVNVKGDDRPGAPTGPTIIEREIAKKEDPDDLPRKKQEKMLVEYDNTDRLVVEANHLYNKGRYYEALQYVDEVIRKKPNFLRAHMMKGSLLYVLGQKDLAQDSWKKALALDPENKDIQALMERYK